MPCLHSRLCINWYVFLPGLTVQTQSGASPHFGNDSTGNGHNVFGSIPHICKLTQPCGLLDTGSANSQGDSAILDLLFELMSVMVRDRLVCVDGDAGQGRGTARGLALSLLGRCSQGPV